MDQLTEILLLLSNSLLIPVVIGLLLFCAWSLLQVGTFVREWHDRTRTTPAWREFVITLRTRPNDQTAGFSRSVFESGPFPGFLATFASRGRALQHSRLHLSELVSELEIESAERLSRLNVGVRIPPMLGLMGTMIPLGPALIGLSRGDLDSLARNLVVAFSTTVVGLFAGGISYALSHVRRHWYSQDLAAIEYVFACLFTDADNFPQSNAGETA